MANQVTRQRMTSWLLAHGFTEVEGKATSHRRFKGPGVSITLPGHGPQDLTKKHVGMILRSLEQAGFDKDAVKEEL